MAVLQDYYLTKQMDGRVRCLLLRYVPYDFQMEEDTMSTIEKLRILRNVARAVEMVIDVFLD